MIDDLFGNLFQEPTNAIGNIIAANHWMTFKNPSTIFSLSFGSVATRFLYAKLYRDER